MVAARKEFLRGNMPWGLLRHRGEQSVLIGQRVQKTLQIPERWLMQGLEDTFQVEGTGIKQDGFFGELQVQCLALSSQRHLLLPLTTKASTGSYSPQISKALLLTSSWPSELLAPQHSKGSMLQHPPWHKLKEGDTEPFLPQANGTELVLSLIVCFFTNITVIKDS